MTVSVGPWIYVLGLDQGQAGVSADYSQWEAARRPAPRKPAVTETPAPLWDAPKRKLSYLEQHEWDGMEARILQAEQQLSARQRELQEAASEGKRLAEESTGGPRPHRGTVRALG